jgi:hypothetical protein
MTLVSTRILIVDIGLRKIKATHSFTQTKISLYRIHTYRAPPNPIQQHTHT